MHKDHPLEKLAVADPDLAATVAAALRQISPSAAAELADLIVEETLWALSQEISFGCSVARGYADLLASEDREKLLRFKDLVRRFGNRGPTLGKMMADHLVPVLKSGDKKLLERFIDVVDCMLKKGAYTLPRPLQYLSTLMEASDLRSVFTYLDLLDTTFSNRLSYVQSQNFARILPSAVADFAPSRRVWQMEMLTDLIRADFRLAEPFLDGLRKGLNLLSKNALHRFVAAGLDKLAHHRQHAARFLALESKLGHDTFTEMQVAVSISHVRHQLNRYLRARTGMAVSVRAMSSLSKAYAKEQNQTPLICSDGNFIYLPSKIDLFPDKADNTMLYKLLVRLEAGYYEFHTFAFDLEKVIAQCQGHLESIQETPELRLIQNLESGIQQADDLSDWEQFIACFPRPDLASDLFTLFEHGRIRLKLAQYYPGIMRRAMPIFRWEIDRMNHQQEALGSLFELYTTIALGIFAQQHIAGRNGMSDHIASLATRFEKRMDEDSNVESSAELVLLTYWDVVHMLKQHGGLKSIENDYIPLSIPFGRKIYSDLFFSAYRKHENLAKKLKIKIEAKGYKIYKSDISRHLAENNGVISRQDLEDMIFYPSGNDGSKATAHRQRISVDLSWLDLNRLFGDSDGSRFDVQDFSGPVSWYKEWSDSLNDYLQAHVRVLDQTIPCIRGDFYDLTLQRYRGLIKKIRYAFEMLKPEGLVRLRQWIEGDEFDYRAMLDFAVDKKAGKMPSERLYIKHIKQLRDVSVLLLVDLSRSTSNPVLDSKTTVMDVEKEAIVLFCQALDVVGDNLAIAGFSGSGRLGVDYFRVKDFSEKIDERTKHRINALAPRRSTRMGAAIRHATQQLQALSAKIRLLVVLSDGFPNDLDYKQNYAVSDTRKAISEARSKNIYTHGITINVAGDSRLDDLYGNVHHNIISDVRELPDKLLRIYSSLTRH